MLPSGRNLILLLSLSTLRASAGEQEVEDSALLKEQNEQKLLELHARRAEILQQLTDVEEQLGVQQEDDEDAEAEDERVEEVIKQSEVPVVRMDTEGFRSPVITKEASCKAANVCGRFVRGNPCQCSPKCHHYGNCCPDYEAVCNGYMPRNKELLSPSPAPLYTFYMYRAQSDVAYPPLNANTASLGGVLWYLQNEVVNRCDSGRGRGEKGYRRFKISRILRYKVQTRATAPMHKQGMNFGSRVAFDFGKNTGAFYPWDDMKKNYEVYGYNVGCSKLGDNGATSPYPKCPSNEGRAEGFCPVQYPDAYWYSMPGPCPEQDIKHKSAKCQSDSPGGYCKGTPTGQGNCTWSFEDAGEVNIDDVVGITAKYGNHQNFCRKNCLEYVKYGRYKDKGRCVNFWDSRMDVKKNQERMDKIDAAFKKKYPDMPSEKDLPVPQCSFKKQQFYKTLKQSR